MQVFAERRCSSWAWRLRAFVEGGSIAEASLRLRRSASQVSRLLAALEDDVGYALLVKEGRRLTLTEPGRQLYERIGEMLRANDALTDYLRHARRKSRTHVNVLVAQHLIDGLLVDAIAGATREEPDFGASVNARMPPNVDAWISQQHFDIALAQLPVEHPLLVTETLAETHAVVVFGPDDPRADLSGPITRARWARAGSSACPPAVRCSTATSGPSAKPAISPRRSSR